VEVVLCGLWALYLIPFFVACRHDHPRWSWILALNFLFGWTLVGWWLLLRWARTPAIAAEPEPIARRAHLRLLPGGGDQRGRFS
jgi:hypothetical protein